MYFIMTTSDKKIFRSKMSEGSETEIARVISMLIAEGGGFELELGGYVFFSKKIAENSTFLLYPE